MPFVQEIFWIKTPIKAWQFVQNTLRCSVRHAQSVIDRGRLHALPHQIPLHKSQMIQGHVSLLHFKALHRPTITPFFSTPYFYAYYKPKNLYSHPKNYQTPSLYESVYAFNPCSRLLHRLDYETSGIVLASRTKRHENALRELFSNRQIQKTYWALVLGDVHAYAQGPFSIVLKILEPTRIRGDLGIRCRVDSKGKFSATGVEIIKVYASNVPTTLLKITPLTGRTHQIRLHLSALGFPIVGEPLYTHDSHARAYLDAKKLDFQGNQHVFKTYLSLEATSLEFTWLGLRYFLKVSQHPSDRFVMAHALKCHKCHKGM